MEGEAVRAVVHADVVPEGLVDVAEEGEAGGVGVRGVLAVAEAAGSGWVSGEMGNAEDGGWRMEGTYERKVDLPHAESPRSRMVTVGGPFIGVDGGCGGRSGKQCSGGRLNPYRSLAVSKQSILAAMEDINLPRTQS